MKMAKVFRSNFWPWGSGGGGRPRADSRLGCGHLFCNQ